MSLFSATLAPALLLLVLGAAFLTNLPAFERAAKAFPRSTTATILCFGAAALWFLWLVNNLSPADFGDYRLPLLALFAIVAVGAFFVARDFLAVRGLAILLLLAARPLLDAAFLQPPQSRLFLVAFVYAAMILAGLILGAMPYLLRDALNWLWEKPLRPRALGAILTLYGALLTAVACTYPA
jgi:hypothetical protein